MKRIIDTPAKEAAASSILDRAALNGVLLTPRRLAARALARLTLFQRFMMASLVILLVGAYVIGSYVSGEIERRVINRTSAITALYVDSVISPHVQELAAGHDISAEHLAMLNQLLVESSLGEDIATFKVWHNDGDVVYSENPAVIGMRFTVADDLARALEGRIVTNMSGLDDDENVFERAEWDSLIETYVPVRQDETGEIIGAVEFYQDPAALKAEIAGSRRDGWLIVGGSTAVMYLLLVGMVGGASSTIRRQHERLDQLARRNAALARRVGMAAARKTETDELLLKRIAQDLHDGPAQDVGLVLLRLDSAKAARGGEAAPDVDTELMRTALNSALKEIRQISAGLRLPDMEDLGVAEVIRKSVQSHREKTGDTVRLSLCAGLPVASVPVKIALYRVTQEALNNIHQHSGVTSADVRTAIEEGYLILEIRDRGSGNAQERRNEAAAGSSLGIRGMRERIEMLGGTITITSAPGEGTAVRAVLPLEEA